jgi:hypothetical protein
MSDQQTNINQTPNTTAPNAQTPAKQSISSTNSVPPLSSDKDKKRQDKNNKILRILAVLFFILILGELGFVFFYHRSSFNNTLQSPLSMLSWTKSKNNTTNINTQPVISVTLPPIPSNVTIPVPTEQQYIKGTGAASGFTAQIEKVVENPTDTSGDKPLKGFQYIEVDLTVTNNTGNTTLIPGMFYFQDAITRKLYMLANIFGYVQAYNWIIPGFSQRRVTIPSKNILMTTEIPSEQTVNNLYLIYQVFPGEKGKIVWDTADTIKEIKFGEKVSPSKIINYYLLNKIFELNATNNEDNRIEVFSFP